MRRTRLRASASTAIATARYVFPVPAGPMPTTITCCMIVRTYSRCPGVFAWITRRRPGRMILYSPGASAPGGAVGAPEGACCSSRAIRSTSSMPSISPMRARSTRACATGVARSTASPGPASESVSPRNDTRTPMRLASSTRLPSFTPASASGSTPSAERRWVTSSLMAASPGGGGPPGPPGWRARGRPRTGRGRPSSWETRSRRAGWPLRPAA